MSLKTILLLDLDGVSFGKLRASYAEAPIFPGTYATSPTYSSGTAYGSLASLAVPNTLANPQLTGGMRVETEFGLEMRFLDNRLGFDFTYFDREDSKLPVAVTAAGGTGYTGLSVNSKITSSTGVEVMISGTPILTDDLRLTLSTLVLKEIYLMDGYHGQVWTFKKLLVKNGVCYMEEKEQRMKMVTGYTTQVVTTDTKTTNC